MSSDKPRLIIITGLAGAGKSTASNALEDMGFYTIDNLPVFLLDPLLQEAADGALPHDKFALVMDCRDPSFCSSFTPLLPRIKKVMRLEVLFLDSDTDTLLRRFSQHRRLHPLADNRTNREAIELETARMRELRLLADRIIDTSTLTPTDLARRLRSLYSTSVDAGMVVNLLSFGFKHGIPVEADLVWDMRFLPNPYWIPELKPLTGLEERVARYVVDSEAGRRFLQLIEPLLAFLVPQYADGGKTALTIAIGCTGGKHRSVAITEQVRALLQDRGITPYVAHRDIDKA